MKKHPFTPYPEVNTVLEPLLADVQAILGSQLLGLYLYGSLAYGGFDQDSDVDFIVVTDGELSPESFAALTTMHDRLAKLDSWCATQREGAYIPQTALRVYDPARAYFFHINRGPEEHLHRIQIDDPNLSRAWWGGWVMLRLVLRENGISLLGPDPAGFIDPVPPDELKQAVLAILHGRAEPLLEHPEVIPKRGYQSYFVLTMCRILYTLEHGTTVSKQTAARWAQEKLGNPWPALITRAGDGRHHPDEPASAEDIKATQDFIRFTLAQAEAYHPEK